MNEKIRRTRERLGLSQEELEAKAGLPKRRVAKWESGQGEPHARHLTGLASALCVPVAWLCDPDATGDPPPSGLPSDEEAVLRTYRRAKGVLSHEDVVELIAEARGRRLAGPRGAIELIYDPANDPAVSRKPTPEPKRRRG